MLRFYILVVLRLYLYLCHKNKLLCFLCISACQKF